MAWFRQSNVLVAMVTAAAACAAPAGAQQLVAALTYTGGLPGGPNATDYEPPLDDRDLWVIEDFSVSTAVALHQFKARGVVANGPGAPVVLGVTAQIHPGWPPDHPPIVVSSPGLGSYDGLWFSAPFAGQVLPPGTYYLTYSVAVRTSMNWVAVSFSEVGPHTVGGGEPDNGFIWNPKGGWALPGNIRAIPLTILGEGRSGANFQIYGTPLGPCRPDLTTGAVAGQPGYGVPNGVLNNDDFFYYLAQFAAGNVAVADLTTGAVAGQPGYGVPNGIVNNDDFFYYLAIFAAGC